MAKLLSPEEIHVDNKPSEEHDKDIKDDCDHCSSEPGSLVTLEVPPQLSKVGDRVVTAKILVPLLEDKEEEN
jgi:hypothetical protein